MKLQDDCIAIYTGPDNPPDLLSPSYTLNPLPTGAMVEVELVFPAFKDALIVYGDTDGQVGMVPTKYLKAVSTLDSDKDVVLDADGFPEEQT